MDKDKLREKLEKASQDLRDTAKAVDSAITTAKREKAKEEAKAKAAPKTASGVADFEAIIEKGTLSQRATLLCRQHDSKEDYNTAIGIYLNEEQEKRLTDKLNTPKGRATMKELQRLYNQCISYGKFILGLRKIYQTSASELAVLCEEWKGYDRQAELITELVAEWRSRKQPLTDEEIKAKLEGVSSKRVKFELLPDGKVVANVDGEKGLYHYILDLQGIATTNLRILRTAIEPFSDFVYSNVTLPSGAEIFVEFILPNVVGRIMEYPDAISFETDPANNQFFSYHLRKRREAGEGDSITPEEKKRAVIPDYNQQTELPEYLVMFKQRLADTISYYDPQKDYE